MSENETRYWLVKNLSYEDTVKQLADGSDLIIDYQRDAKKNETRFWPGSKGVYTYLSEHLPLGSEIRGDEIEKRESEFKRPVIVHRMGMDID